MSPRDWDDTDLDEAWGDITPLEQRIAAMKAQR